MKPEIDEITGRATTGHEWNGIKELNTPMPRAFSIWLWASIAVAALMWALYPSFPYFSGYLGGALGYSSRVAVDQAVVEGRALRAASFEAFETGDLEELAQDTALRDLFEPQIAVLYRDNCSGCHGRDARGARGFPDLTDEHWLWSGSAEEIEYTLQVGINADHPATRFAEMPAFGRNEMLDQAQIADVVEYLVGLSGREHDTAAARRGDAIFVDNCESCHDVGGAGHLENGAPDLTDAAWIYGGDRDALRETLRDGRAGVMPAWSNRLTPSEIRQLTIYLLWRRPDDDGR